MEGITNLINKLTNFAPDPNSTDSMNHLSQLLWGEVRPTYGPAERDMMRDYVGGAILEVQENPAGPFVRAKFEQIGSAVALYQDQNFQLAAACDLVDLLFAPHSLKNAADILKALQMIDIYSPFENVKDQIERELSNYAEYLWATRNIQELKVVQNSVDKMTIFHEQAGPASVGLVH